MRTSKDKQLYETQFIITGVLIGTVLVMDVYLVILLKNLTTKWRRASEKSLIKSGKELMVLSNKTF